MTDTQAPADRRAQLAATGMALAWWAEQQPDVPAIIAPTGTRTFAQFNAGANRLARALRARSPGRPRAPCSGLQTRLSGA